MSSDPEQPLIEVRIEEEATVAKVAIPDDFDPDLLDEKLLAQLVRKRGIPLDPALETRLSEIVEAFRSEPGALEEVVAQSPAPVDGKDGWLEWVEGFDPTAGPAVAEDDSDTVDYYNQVSYIPVAKGTHVATVHEPTPGEDGKTVTGRPIKAKPGRRCGVRVDSTLSQDGTGCVVAQADGILEYERGVIKVSRLFEVRGSVDFGTGNIDFDGSVVVREGIRDRFQINATGDVIVEGLIEAATIDCGRNFACHQGMAAKGKGRLTVAGDAVANYLDDVKGHIQGNLTVQRELINCALAVGGKLTCDRGTMIGGNVAVGGGVQIAALGCAAGRPTTLTLARLVPPAGEEGTAGSPEPTSAVGAVDVLIHKAIYPAVSLVIGEFEVKFDVALKGPLRIGLDENRRLVLREADGEGRPLESVAKIIHRAA
jgi:uncharacterized protein (DUF342 family)